MPASDSGIHWLLRLRSKTLRSFNKTMPRGLPRSVSCRTTADPVRMLSIATRNRECLKEFRSMVIGRFCAIPLCPSFLSESGDRPSPAQLLDPNAVAIMQQHWLPARKAIRRQRTRAKLALTFVIRNEVSRHDRSRNRITVCVEVAQAKALKMRLHKGLISGKCRRHCS